MTTQLSTSTSTKPPPSLQSDLQFWVRTNTPSPTHDHPSIAPSPSPNLPLFLLLSTPAGKPLFHFVHQHPPPHPHLLSTLSAATVAFQASNPQVQTLRTEHSISLFLTLSSIHVSVSCLSPQLPPSFLRTLARVAIQSVYMSLSLQLDTYLKLHPNADILSSGPSTDWEVVSRVAHVSFTELLSHPLPFCLGKPVSLPCPTGPCTRGGVVEWLKTALHTWRSSVKAALIFTASPPYPRRLVVVGGEAQVGGSELAMLASLMPKGKDAGIIHRLYLGALGGFLESVAVVSRVLELRLSAEDYEDFYGAVGGGGWRPEWNSGGGGCLWGMTIVERGKEEEGEAFLDCLEKKFWKGGGEVRELMVCMERPWGVRDMRLEEVVGEGIVQRVRAIVLIGERKIVGTVGSFAFREGMQVIRCLAEWERRDEASSGHAQRGREWIMVEFPRDKGFVVMWEGRFIVCFDDQLDLEEGLKAVRKGFVPWMKRFEGSLLPDNDRVIVPPRTPLAGILSPFQT